ncbi:MAG: hypothetical protein MZU97_03750 [Bacillus subtilis]|nr:hypothetical protein [Bacillus subtilis]
MILINDTIRETAPDTLKSFVDAGVTVKIISGDNALTVLRRRIACRRSGSQQVSLAR